MRTSTVLAGLAVVAAGVACNSTTGIQNNFAAMLNGIYEVPAVPTSTGAANATFTLDASGLTLNYTLNITAAASSNYTASHIHTGAAGASGPVRVNLCGAGTAPACPTGTGTVTSSFTATSDTMTLPGSPTLNWHNFVVALRGRGTYANLHSVTNAGGEIRGQILATQQ